jgi:hypothetical protein
MPAKPGREIDENGNAERYSRSSTALEKARL